MGIFADAKTAELIFSASAISAISALEAFAEAANRSATLVASAPARPNAFIALAAIVAACVFEICPATAICKTPLEAPNTSFTSSPALLSSNMASATSAADVPGSVRSAPSACACSRSVSMSAAVAPLVACNTFILRSKSAASFVAATPMPIRGSVTHRDRLLPICCALRAKASRPLDAPCIAFCAPLASPPITTMSFAAVIVIYLVLRVLCLYRSCRRSKRFSARLLSASISAASAARYIFRQALDFFAIFHAGIPAYLAAFTSAYHSPGGSTAFSPESHAASFFALPCSRRCPP